MKKNSDYHCGYRPYGNLSKQLLTMKMIVILLFCGIMTVNASVAYSQNTKISLDLKNSTIDQVLSKIEDQSEFYFLLNQDLVDITREVNITADNKTIKEVLTEMFEGSDVNFLVNDRQIILFPENSGITGLEIQQHSVRGKVTDSSTGEALPGVNIAMKGTTVGTISDLDGGYSLNVPDPDGILVFTFIGYKSVEVNVQGRDVIDVQLVLQDQALEEITVVGYGVQRKSDVTGAISQVKTEDLQSRSAVTAEKAMQGKVAGVQVVNTSGAPGKTGTIRVRGVSSNNAAQPLFVVDGLIVTDIANIDPTDIQSIEILKDAAAAAIYGVASGNGVVLVTTKKGKAGEGKVTYDFQYTTNQLPKYPDVLNADEYINYMVEGGYLAQSAIDSYWNGTTDTDWLKETFETGISQRHNLGFQGGNERGSYYISASYTHQDGIVKGDKDVYKRLGGVINLDYKVKDWLKISTTNILEKYDLQTVSEATEYGGLLGSALVQDPLTPVSYAASELPSYMQSVLDGGVYPLLQDEETGRYWAFSNVNVQDQTNPFIMRDQTDSFNGGFNMNGTFTIDLTPIKGLTLTSKLGYRVGYDTNYTYQKPYYGNTIVLRENLVISRTNSTFFRYQWDNYANYTRIFGRHSITALAGMSYIQPFSNSTGGSVNDIIKDDPLYRDIAYQTATATRTVSGNESNYGRLYSVFSRLNYGFADKYLFQASIRRDAGDRNYFPPDKSIGVFPAVSFGYVISNEDFFPKDIFINNLKLRASWGQNGTYSHLSGFLWRASIASSGSVPYTEDIAYQIGSAPNRLENPELTWETTEQTNIGLDARALKDRLTMTLDWYVKTSKDLLVTITPPYETGQSSATINAGNVRNSGVELELGWQDNVGDFTYAISGNMATLKNEVTYLDPSITRISGASMHISTGLTVFEEGYPIWYMRGFEFIDVDDATGDPIFKDQNEDGAINDADKVMLGKGIPDLTYGLTLSAGYKGFDFLVFGAGQSGSQIYNCFTRVDRPNGNKLTYYYTDRWTAENTDGTMPRPGANQTDYFYASSGVVFDGSFFKIKQIQLGYTVPSQMTKKINVSNLRVYVSLDDWITFSDYIGYDPEVSTNAGSSLGVDKGSYPIAKKLMFGVNLTF